MKTKARYLRQNQTEAEQALWRQLRNRQLMGYKFRRQYVIKPYIVDFVCVAAKLIVEIDGGQHAEQRHYDQRRSRLLESQGYRVVRYWNNEVLNNMEGVLEALTLALSQGERGSES
ncbi:MAG: endonuclease domain-containing protein [Gammaproteobacteria bacterium]|nr:endonuclease domain-containing protein [Gammaproteobacteria bacterium]